MIKSPFDLLEKGSRKKMPKPESVRPSMNSASSQTQSIKGTCTQKWVERWSENNLRKVSDFFLIQSVVIHKCEKRR